MTTLGVKTIFTFLAEKNNCDIICVADDKGGAIELQCLLPQHDKQHFMELLAEKKVTRGCELVTIASKGKQRACGRRVITHILKILPATQFDLENFI